MENFPKNWKYEKNLKKIKKSNNQKMKKFWKNEKNLKKKKWKKWKILWELCPSHFLKWPKMDQKRKNPFKNGKFSKKNEILKKMKILKKNQIMKKFWKKWKNFEKNI